MSALAAGTGVTSVAGFGTDWLYLFVPLAGYLALCGLAVARGRGPTLLQRLGNGFARVTGLPGWAAVGYATGIASMLIAALGFFWDVAWHIDYGRDELLFTPGHSAILLGLGMIPVAAALMVAIATLDRAEVGFRFRSFHVPWTALTLAVLGCGAMIGFPLDELWHRAYGVDVSMWGPTHITMIGGASLAPLTLLLMLREAGPGRNPAAYRRITAVLAGATLVGCSTFQLEYDLGVSQWQQLLHPVLVSLAAGFALVVARRVLGVGGALIATVHWLFMRTAIAFIVGGPLHHRTPHFALYIGSALAVELAFFIAQRRSPLAQGVVAGVLVGTVGLAADWAWTHVFGLEPWRGTLTGPRILVATAVAVAAAVLGIAAGRVIAGERANVARRWMALAGVVLVGSVAALIPRHAVDGTGTVRTSPAGPGRVTLEVLIDPPSLARDADRFSVLSWQGGHAELAELQETSPGLWTTDRPVPVGGSWKTLVRLARADALVAIPVFLPLDEEIGAPETPVVAERSAPLVRDTNLLMREAHAGPVAPAIIAYTAVGGIAIAWIASLLLAFTQVSRRRRTPLDGKRVVVSGALGGIGAAITKAYRDAGARVVGFDLVAGDDVMAVDVTDQVATERAMRAAVTQLGGIDVLVNLAGIGRAQDSGALPDADARRTVDINFWGTWNVTASAIPWLTESHGHVVVTASGLAIVPMPWAAAYAASKRAVSAYADSLRLEYAGRLTVTTMNPGYVRTPIHDVVAASGASLEGVVGADSMESVVDGYLHAVVDRPRTCSTSTRSALLFRLGALRPGVTDAFIRLAVARLRRPDPTFVQSAEELTTRREPAPERASTR